MVGGCLAQKDRDAIAGARPRTWTWCSVPTTCGGPSNCSLSTGSGSSGAWRSSRPPSPRTTTASPPPCPWSVRSAWAAWVTIQIGCDNNCAFCIVPAVRGPEISRPFGDVVAEVDARRPSGVTEVTLLGQNVNSYGRDLTLAPALRRRRERDADDVRQPAGRGLGPGRRRARPLFADLLRAVGACRGHPPGPLHESTPEGPATRDDRSHGRRPTRSANTCTCRCSRAATTDARPPCTGATPPSATWRRWPIGPGRRSRPRGDHRHHRRLPRRDRGGLRRHPRGRGRGPLRQRLHLRLLAPAGHRGRSSSAAPPCPTTVAVERMARLRAVVERSSRLGNEARVGRLEEVLVEGPSRRNPDRLTGRTRHNRLVHFAPPRADPARHVRRGGDHRRLDHPPARRVPTSCSPSRPTAPASPWPRRERRWQP